jgi:hypothetical protein
MITNPKLITTRVNGANEYIERFEFSSAKMADKVAKLINEFAVDTTAIVESGTEEISVQFVTVDLRVMSGFNVTIGEQEIDDEVFEKQLVDYVYEDRADLLENIRNMRCEASDADKNLMDEDIQYLLTLNDNYVFSSASTNEYISPIEDTERFNEICADILDANETLKTIAEEIKIVVTNVDWEGVEGFEEPIKITIPAKTLTSTDSIKLKNDIQEYVSDELSNVSGFCHKSFEYEICSDADETLK